VVILLYYSIITTLAIIYTYRPFPEMKAMPHNVHISDCRKGAITVDR